MYASSFRERRLHAIYKLNANRLTIAYRIDGPTPEKFESTPGSGVTLLVMEKVKPAKLEAGPGGGPANQSNPPVVTVVQPVVREISDYEDFTGTITAREKVEARAHVTGTLLKVYFQGGASVKQGALLAEIDPRSYQAEVDKREADVRLAQARLKPLTAAVAEIKKLIEAKKGVSFTDRNEAVGQQAEAEAALQAAREELKIAKLNLGYTKIVAPIAGKISQPELDPGNMVVTGSTRLATIVSQGPVYVDFGVDPHIVSRLRRTDGGRTEAARQSRSWSAWGKTMTSLTAARSSPWTRRPTRTAPSAAGRCCRTTTARSCPECSFACG